MEHLVIERTRHARAPSNRIALVEVEEWVREETLASFFPGQRNSSMVVYFEEAFIHGFE